MNRARWRIGIGIFGIMLMLQNTIELLKLITFKIFAFLRYTATGDTVRSLAYCFSLVANIAAEACDVICDKWKTSYVEFP